MYKNIFKILFSFSHFLKQGVVTPCLKIFAFVGVITNKLFLLILFFTFSSPIFSQKSNSTKFQKLEMQDANLYYENDFYHLALPIYQGLYSTDSLSEDLNFKIGICNFKLNNKSIKVLKYFERAEKSNIKSHFYKAQILHYNEKFDDAITQYNLYKTKSTVDVMNDFVDENIQKSLYAKKCYENPQDINILNVGLGVNSRFNDYVPLVTADDSTLYFTSRRKNNIDDKTDADNQYFEDIFVSHKQGKYWRDAENVDKPINTEGHDATVSITPDGKKIFIYRTNNALTGGDIYETINSKGIWSKPEKMKGEINCKSCWNSSGSISPDENTFYFSSNKEGGFGGKDLYKVEKLPNGEWSKSTNLGDKINTIYDDDAPFIHQDGQTLYFSSKGHENMGGYDVFKTELSDSGTWSKPENLAYPINSAKDDIFFVVSANGKKAYYSSEKPDGYGKNDIYEVEMLNNSSNYVVIKGNVISNIPNERIEAEVTITDIEKNQVKGIYRTNSNTQRYVMVLLPHRKYLCEIEAEGFKSFSYEINLKTRISYEDLFKNIILEKIPTIE
jgi:hypothetical protein